jgi:hypothetical protein
VGNLTAVLVPYIQMTLKRRAAKKESDSNSISVVRDSRSRDDEDHQKINNAHTDGRDTGPQVDMMGGVSMMMMVILVMSIVIYLTRTLFRWRSSSWPTTTT